MAKLIAYIRVSTTRQGLSGLGLDAQRAAVAAYATANGHQIVCEVQEVESGKRCDRPQLDRALSLCRVHRATLCVAKLDRLSRDLAFIACMMRDKVKFVCCDNEHANETTIGMLAVFAQHEAKCISERTIAALAQAKRRGVVLGGSRSHLLTSAERARGQALGGAARKRAARERYSAVLPIVRDLQEAGCVTLQQIASGLNERGVPTAAGTTWHPVQVSRVLSVTESVS